MTWDMSYPFLAGVAILCVVVLTLCLKVIVDDLKVK